MERPKGHWSEVVVHLYIHKHTKLYLQEFVFSHDKATSSLKEYFHALEMDKAHIYVVFTYKASFQ